MQSSVTRIYVDAYKMMEHLFVQFDPIYKHTAADVGVTTHLPYRARSFTNLFQINNSKLRAAVGEIAEEIRARI